MLRHEAAAERVELARRFSVPFAALVFTLLVSVYIGLICNHGDDHHEDHGHGEDAAHLEAVAH